MIKNEMSQEEEKSSQSMKYQIITKGDGEYIKETCFKDNNKRIPTERQKPF